MKEEELISNYVQKKNLIYSDLKFPAFIIFPYYKLSRNKLSIWALQAVKFGILF